VRSDKRRGERRKVGGPDPHRQNSTRHDESGVIDVGAARTEMDQDRDGLTRHGHERRASNLFFWRVVTSALLMTRVAQDRTPCWA